MNRLRWMLAWWAWNPEFEPYTSVPMRQWPLRKRLFERAFRLTHHGQVRTLVLRSYPIVTAERGGDDERFPAG